MVERNGRELEDGRTGVDITIKYNTAEITKEEQEELADFILRAKEYGCGCHGD